MRQQAGIEKDGANRSDDPVENGTVARGSDGEDVGRKRPRDKREDEDEAPVESNLDPEQSPEPDAGIHRKRSLYRVTRVDRKSTRLNSSHSQISYAVFCLKKKNTHKH